MARLEITLDVGSILVTLASIILLVYGFARASGVRMKTYYSTLENVPVDQFILISKPGGKAQTFLCVRSDGLYFVERHINTDEIPRKVERFYLTVHEVMNIRKLAFQSSRVNRRGKVNGPPQITEGDE